jgi:tRNA A37 threonylcarbamoyladenosine dehydratase
MRSEQTKEKLSGVHVAVFGLGGAGSWCAEALVRAGVGRLTLVDDDMVSPAHLESQAQATHATFGQPKAIALAVRLRDINPEGQYTPKCYRYSAQGREDFFPADYDYVVDAMGQIPCKLDLIETARNQGIPVVSVLDLGGQGDASRLQIAELAGLDDCPPAQALRDALAAKGIEQLKVVFSPESTAQTAHPAPWVPPVAGFLLAQAVLQEVSL